MYTNEHVTASFLFCLGELIKTVVDIHMSSVGQYLLHVIWMYLDSKDLVLIIRLYFMLNAHNHIRVFIFIFIFNELHDLPHVFHTMKVNY